MSNIASGGSEYAAIFHGLEELLFFRLRRDQEWHLRNDLSSVFEQLQLSESLGKLQLLHKFPVQGLSAIPSSGGDTF